MFGQTAFKKVVPSKPERGCGPDQSHFEAAAAPHEKQKASRQAHVRAARIAKFLPSKIPLSRVINSYNEFGRRGSKHNRAGFVLRTIFCFALQFLTAL